MVPKVVQNLNLPTFVQLSVGNTIKKNHLTADSLGLVKMKRYIIEQHIYTVEEYFKNNERLVVTVRKFLT